MLHNAMACFLFLFFYPFAYMAGEEEKFRNLMKEQWGKHDR